MLVLEPIADMQLVWPQRAHHHSRDVKPSFRAKESPYLLREKIRVHDSVAGVKTTADSSVLPHLPVPPHFLNIVGRNSKVQSSWNLYSGYE